MAQKVTLPTQEILTRKQVADEFNIPIGYLEKNATNGNGPPLLRINRSVRYKRSDIVAWLESLRDGFGREPQT